MVFSAAGRSASWRCSRAKVVAEEPGLGRWSSSRRRREQGQPSGRAVLTLPALSRAGDERRGCEGSDVAQPDPPPTLEDVQLLTAQSDFSRFVAGDVTPEVKNAAMKKLFTDPRYNVMDGLDVYTGDYSQPDPIPDSMLQSLVSAKFLRLFDEAPEEPGEPRDVADNPTGETVAQCEPAPPAVPEPPQDADPDLRLQQDHATPGEDPGRGTG